ncbi:hypothetical protein ACHAW6_004597 [Cyclotella cf. meneghiniana]
MCLLTSSFLFFGTVAIVTSLLRKEESDAVPSSEVRTNSSHQKVLSLPSPEETLNLIRNRRSIFTKQFTGKPVPNRIIVDMLKAAKWAPNHHITEPWRFFVYESESGCASVGRLLQQLYKSSCAPEDDDGSSMKKPFSRAKYEKKLKGAVQSSHIIAICVETNTKNPLVEEVCSVAMAVQNMHLMATVHGVGAYWSSGGVYGASDGSSPLGFLNPKALTQFLDCGESVLCLGWFFVGDYYGAGEEKAKVWPSSRRSSVAGKVVWR